MRPGVGYFYALTPIYVANRLQAMLGVEQTIRMESFFTPGSLPMNVTILDDNGPVADFACRVGQQY
ncbi:two-component sensor protein RcsC [Klebsiella grimontii]|uniref:Two-component sensor protein RcsC n=1 Tax=Klebsiella grimontii TaxID=2058152 RepID=A0A7H4NZS7_9ENTR|nr:two-component sensor protein RcsC [Klebsiella grimontii]